MTTTLPPQTRAYLSTPELAPLWTAARTRLERNGLRPAGVLTLELTATAADRLSGLIGRTVESGSGRRIALAELDVALRRSAAGRGLVSVLEALDGRPVTDRAAARRDASAQWARLWQRLDAALADAGLAGAEWVPDWIAGLRRSGILARAGIPAATRAVEQSATALGLLLRSTNEPPVESELATLATQVTGDAHGLDDTSLASAVLLRAAAHRFGQAVAESPAERAGLWRRLGVATDSISGTVLTWQLRPPGDDRWSRMMRERADLGLVTHLTLHELNQAGPVALVESGWTVFVCENPQVLQAAARSRTGTPLLCLSGNPASVGTRLVRALVAAGSQVRYHGDFDWPGVAIAARILSLGATPWRMSADEYREAAARVDADRSVVLAGAPVATGWDPDLAAAMMSCGVAVHEESLLPSLLSDLRQP